MKQALLFTCVVRAIYRNAEDRHLFQLFKTVTTRIYTISWVFAEHNINWPNDAVS